ncbi:hypothetical protein FH972_024959 [Carpinus fangiana]|uniref:RING-type E3 ubiquitin transferase RAD18 n=1 Tax=Carpinus fangiana TaxID=176857 RepID=A0A5N6KZL7_9ROSI|nr:hypothetical protein FH972_024959 [Carpinus fangiana]
MQIHHPRRHRRDFRTRCFCAPQRSRPAHSMAPPADFEVSDPTDWTTTSLANVAPLDSALRCQVCKDFYKNAVITSCAHSFCSICIRRCLTVDGQCPACRSKDQEVRLRRNVALQEVVDAFTRARSEMLTVASEATEREQQIEALSRGQKRKRHENEKPQTGERQTRRSTRQRTQASSTPASTQDSTADEVITIHDSQEDPADQEYNPESEDGLVPCPMCGKRMKEEQVFAHLDRCDIEKAEDSQHNHGKLNALNPSTLVAPKSSDSPPPERLPAMNYALFSDQQMKKKLKALGIPNSGSKQLMMRRHTEWINLWNANCDSSRPVARRELLSELDKWERSQGGLSANGGIDNSVFMKKDFDGRAWATKNKDDFDELIKKARERAKDAKKTAKTDDSKVEGTAATETGNAVGTLAEGSVVHREPEGHHSSNGYGVTPPPPQEQHTSETGAETILPESTSSGPLQLESQQQARSDRESGLPSHFGSPTGDVMKMPMFETPQNPVKDADDNGDSLATLRSYHGSGSTVNSNTPEGIASDHIKQHRTLNNDRSRIKNEKGPVRLPPPRTQTHTGRSNSANEQGRDHRNLLVRTTLLRREAFRFGMWQTAVGGGGGGGLTVKSREEKEKERAAWKAFVGKSAPRPHRPTALGPHADAYSEPAAVKLEESTDEAIIQLSFEEVVLKGLAQDGGLFIPQEIPSIPAEWHGEWPNLSFPQLAFRIFSLYISPSEISPEDLKAIVDKSYSTFRTPKVTPIVNIEEDKQIHLLELFHGPTFAFKDVALQFLGNLFEFFLVRRNQGKTGAAREHLTVIGATSGDTGSAAIYGLRGKKDVSVFMTHPKGKVSPVQEAQMTTVLDENVHNLAIDGTFDDCQDFVKALFQDADINTTHSLAAVNSINWARILAQITYYFYSYASLLKSGRFTPGEKVRFVVPTGNFGDILAGYFAKRMGLPIEKLVIATNENDILNRFWRSGHYEKKPVHGVEANGGFKEDGVEAHEDGVRETLSPAMDILVSSNFERLLWFLALEVNGKGTDKKVAGATVAGWLNELKTNGGFGVDAAILEAAKRDFESERVSDKETLETIKDIYSARTPAVKHRDGVSAEGVAHNGGYILDPHSAIGVCASRRSVQRTGSHDTHHISLATAHPAKFSSAVEEALKDVADFRFDAVLPEQFKGFDTMERRCLDVKKSDGLPGLRELIRSRVPSKQA